MREKISGGGSSKPVPRTDAQDIAAAKAAVAAKAAADRAAAAKAAAAAAAAAKAAAQKDAAARAAAQRDAAARAAAERAAEEERRRREEAAAQEAERRRQEEVARLAAIEEAARKRKGSNEYGVVKNPTRDVLNIASLVPQDSAKKIERILFEQMSAVELSNVLRHDTVDGIEQEYSIVGNLSAIRERYNVTRELSIQDKLSPLYSRFSIDLYEKIPSTSYIEQNGLNATYQYIDENNIEIDFEKGYIYVDTNGDIIIELDNIRPNELLQIQIDQDGTIYEVNN